MGNKNYTKYHQNKETSKNLDKPVVDEKDLHPIDGVTNIEPSVDETIKSEAVVKGIVVGCNKLFVRSEPTINSEPVTVLNENAEVNVNEAESTEDFYKVCLPSSVEGYCMKKYMKISK